MVTFVHAKVNSADVMRNVCYLANTLNYQTSSDSRHISWYFEQNMCFCSSHVFVLSTWLCCDLHRCFNSFKWLFWSFCWTINAQTSHEGATLQSTVRKNVRDISALFVSWVMQTSHSYARDQYSDSAFSQVSRLLSSAVKKKKWTTRYQ